MNIPKIIFSLLFIAIGIGLIYYGFSQPCDIAPTTQEVNGQIIEINQPAQMDMLVCLSTNYISMISILVGAAMIFPGIGGLFKGLTETPETSGKKGKSKKKRK